MKGGFLLIEEKKYFGKPEIYAFTAALISGIVVHTFALTNILHNYDNILQQPRGYGAGITSGRWLLSVLGDMFHLILDLSYNLPLVNGLIFLVAISCTAWLTVKILDIHNRLSAILTGCMMATFPAVCGTMVFRFTVPYYGIALFLSAMAVWTVEKTKCGLLLSALCIACSMGIYQAYVPLSIGLYVLILMRDSLKENSNLRQLVLRGLRYCATLLIGVVAYFALLKLFIFIYSKNGEVVLDAYQGIDSMGKISLRELPGLIRRAWTSAALFSIRDYCNLASTRVMKVIWSLYILMILVVTAYILIRKKIKPLMMAFFCLMGLVFPLAINFIVIMVPDGHIYTIMVYSFVLVGCAPLMLLESLPDNTEKINRRLTRIVGLLTAAIVFYNSYYTNFNYTALYYSNRQVENYLTSLITQIRMTKGYTPEKKWAFLGEIQDPLLLDMWKNQWMSTEQAPFYGGVTCCTAEDLLTTSYSFDFWIYSYVGYFPPSVTEEGKLEIWKDPRVAEMPCWPSEGSIQVLDDYVIVKFQETVQ